MITPILSPRALNRALLARQMLLERADLGPAAAVAKLAGMQAQQAQPPFVGLWTRLNGFERQGLLDAVNDRTVVRATFLRGTLHLVTADDFVAFRSALQPMLAAGAKAVLRARMDSLDVPALVAAARAVFRESPGTFTALRGALLDAYPEADERAMGYVVRTHLPLVAVPDGAAWGYGPDPTFADAEDWLGRAPSPEPDPAPLVLRYLGAFGPATPSDFQAWSGLSGARAVFDALRDRLVTFRDGKRTLFDLPDAPRPSEDTPAPPRLLPGFDNLILGHDDRSRVIADAHRAVVVTKNLQVLATFLVDGVVAGTWKAERKGKTARLTLTPFAPIPRVPRDALAAEAEALLPFVEPDASSRVVEFAKG